MAQVRVSVVIPFYNAADTIEKAVRSVLDQTEPSVEVVIVDDCSPKPGAWESIAPLTNDPRVKAFRLETNHGKAHAVNYGNARAAGEWIAILDNDDWFEPTRLERLLAAARQAGADMAADNKLLIDIMAGGAVVGPAWPKERTGPLDLDRFLAEGSDPFNNFDYGMLKPVFRADFLRKHNITYDESTRIGEDYYILLCFFMAGGKGIMIPDPLYSYVQPFGSISRMWTREGRKPYDYAQMAQLHESYMRRFDGQLTPSQRKHLKRRGTNLKILKHFFESKERLRGKDAAGAAKIALAAPAGFWAFLAGRTLRQAYRAFKLIAI